MRFIHLTDPHFSSLEGQSFASLSQKRRSGYLSWTRRRQLIHRRETLAQLIAAIRLESADQLILSGDLVQIGLKDEIREVRGWLAELAPADQVFFVPGNHDVYAGDSWDAVRQCWNELLPPVQAGTFDGPSSGYPMVRDFGSVRLIGASSACVTPIFLARGALGRNQFDRLAHLLRESREQGRMCLLTIHHPPVPGLAPWRKALKEEQALRELIAEQRPALAICGHLHHNLETTEGVTRIFSTASASLVHEASYRIFDIETGAGAGQASWTIHMQLKTISAQGNAFNLADEQRWTFSL
jgi:3',5'-cyclic AMP phosphodiesterase CpdA